MNEDPVARQMNSRLTVNLMGNTYDVAALVAVVTGAVMVFLCLTCGLGTYCLPLVPIAAGVFGLATAARAVDPKRTRLLSWLGIGAGGLALLLFLALIAVYAMMFTTGALPGLE